MKNFLSKSFFAAACIIAALGCSKNDSNLLETAAVSSASSFGALTVPDLPGYTPQAGVEPGEPIKYPPFPGNPQGSFDAVYTSDTLATPENLKRTCRFTIDHLDEGKTYHQVNNTKINIAFFKDTTVEVRRKIRRLKPTTPAPYGWPADWGVPPKVEKDYPDVLFMDSVESFTIMVSKPCTEFSLELTPNRQGTARIYEMDCRNFDGSSRSGYAYVQASTPSGASMLDLKSDTPFSQIRISYLSWFNAPYYFDVHGIAIANIRYTLAK